MCNFWSAIVKKNGTVLFDEMSDSHEDVIDKYKLKDETADPELLEFARIEITPPRGDVFAPTKDWIFKIDQSCTPVWFTDKNKKDCYKKLKTFASKAIIVGKEIKEVSKGRIWVKDCNVLTAKGNVLICEMWGTSQVRSMWGTSQVGEMWGTSQVGEMRGTSQVGEMRENSRVGSMRETSRVGSMRENSRVGSMRETSRVGSMRETSRVGSMRETSRVGEMWGTSQVGSMRETSQVGEMWGTSQVGEMRETSQVGEMWGTSQVGEMRENSRVGSMREASRVGSMWGTSQVGVHNKDTKYLLKENAIAIINFEQKPKIIVANKNIKIEYQSEVPNV